MDKFTEMVVFTEVARSGSFSAAARTLQMTPSAVSKLISRQEERLEARLFNRTTRNVSLTEGGKAYLKRCLSILNEIEDAEDLLVEFGREPKGILSITSTAGFAQHCLLPLLPDFQRAHPKLTLKLQLSGRTVDLVGENVDVAIRLGKLKDTQLVARKLYECPRVICASPTYLALNGTPQTPADLSQHNCLLLNTIESYNQWPLRSDSGPELIEVSGNFVTDTVHVLHQYALHGAGLVRLAEFMIRDDLQSGRLVPLLQNYNHETQQVHAVFPHRQQLPSKVRVFIDYLIDNL